MISRGSAHEWTDGSAAGVIGLFVGLLTLVTSALDAATFGPGLEVLLPALLALVGGSAVGMNVLRLKQWADDREQKMESIARRAREQSETT